MSFLEVVEHIARLFQFRICGAFKASESSERALNVSLNSKYLFLPHLLDDGISMRFISWSRGLKAFQVFLQQQVMFRIYQLAAL